MPRSLLPRGATLAVGIFLLPATALAQCNDILFLDSFEVPENNDWPVAVEVNQLGDNLPGRSVTLTLNGADPLVVTADGVHCFNDTTPGAATWDIQITEQPTEGNVCSVTPATGVATGPVLVQAVCDTPPTRWGEFDWDAANWN